MFFTGFTVATRQSCHSDSQNVFTVAPKFLLYNSCRETRFTVAPKKSLNRKQKTTAFQYYNGKHVTVTPEKTALYKLWRNCVQYLQTKTRFDRYGTYRCTIWCHFFPLTRLRSHRDSAVGKKRLFQTF